MAQTGKVKGARPVPARARRANALAIKPTADASSTEAAQQAQRLLKE